MISPDLKQNQGNGMSNNVKQNPRLKKNLIFSRSNHRQVIQEREEAGNQSSSLPQNKTNLRWLKEIILIKRKLKNLNP
jgi:hypothetical protein